MKDAPHIGEMLQIRSDIRSMFAGKTGTVTGLRSRKDGIWTAVELDLGSEKRWFSKKDLVDGASPRADQVPAAPRRRGRPPKAKSSSDGVSAATETANPATGRGDPEPRPYITANLGAPKANHVSLRRRTPRHPKSGVQVDIYIGRAVLQRWRDAVGEVRRVSLEVRPGALIMRADPNGQYALDAKTGRMPRIHCDAARYMIDLEDGIYEAN
ncbi:MAG: hypothetical protein MUD01_17785, partial [Chloroflexaceae bacterium]|nr:hypothetical protein [Chloroflexaceae bacterium]